MVTKKSIYKGYIAADAKWPLRCALVIFIRNICISFFIYVFICFVVIISLFIYFLLYNLYRSRVDVVLSTSISPQQLLCNRTEHSI